ncbi:MAG: response regulator [Nitrospiria bacterium]
MKRKAASAGPRDKKLFHGSEGKMNICAKCKETIEMPLEAQRGVDEVTCSKCHARFKVKWRADIELIPEIDPPDVQKKKTSIKVLVAVDGEATQDVMKDVLTREGYEVFLAGTGKEALSILETEHPGVAYLDVALPQVLGFEICEIIKKSSQLKETKVILVSSIYDKMRYKREPKSLYGADDYIERHHIQDLLIPKLKKVIQPGNLDEDPMLAPGLPELGNRQTAGASQPAVAAVPVQGDQGLLPDDAHELLPDEPKEELFPSSTDPDPSVAVSCESGSEIEICQVPSPSQEEVSALSPEETLQHEEAKRFARIIISDIALYNQAAVEEGVENGNVEELLKGEIQEGEKLYRERVPKEVWERTDYLQQALFELVERKKKLMKQQK